MIEVIYNGQREVFNNWYYADVFMSDLDNQGINYNFNEVIDYDQEYDQEYE